MNMTERVWFGVVPRTVAAAYKMRDGGSVTSPIQVLPEPPHRGVVTDSCMSK
jgi:hypothetical protein